MNRKQLSTALVAALVVALTLLALGQRPTLAQQTSEAADPVQRTVSVNGMGTVSAAPDKATISLGVRTDAKSADEALDENTQRMTSLISALRRAGVDRTDIQTTDFSIWPQYRSSSTGETTTITGYEVSNAVQITVRDLDKFGAVLDAAIRAGGNQVHGIQFGFSDPAALYDQAREQAMGEARRKAEQLAELADVEVGTVVSINESDFTPAPMARTMAMSDMAEAAVPIESGQSAISLSVQVTYQLVP